MSNDHITRIVGMLTYNAALAVSNTVEHPHPDIPRLLNGDQGRLYTGMGQWTERAANHLLSTIKACGLLEKFDAQPIWEPGARNKPWLVDVLNDLGMEVARYLVAHWDDALFELRDASCAR